MTTAKEIIDILSLYPPETEVYIYNHAGILPEGFGRPEQFILTDDDDLVIVTNLEDNDDVN